MIPRAMSEIFKRAEAKRKESGAGSSWECRLSFLELYNEVRTERWSGSILWTRVDFQHMDYRRNSSTCCPPCPWRNPHRSSSGRIKVGSSGPASKRSP